MPTTPSTAGALGRRERKKIARRAEILACARALFARRGFEQTSVEQIAEAADVAAATVYNFFPGKTELLMELHTQEIERQLGLRADRLAACPDNPADGVFMLLEILMEVMEQFPRREIQIVTAHALLTGHDSVAGRTYASTDTLFENEVAERLAIYRDRLPAGTDIPGLARLIYSAASGEFLLWTANDAMPTAEIMGRVRRFLDILLPTDGRESDGRRVTA